MGGSNIINEYFRQFEKQSNYKKINQIIGFEYTSLDKNREDEVLRFFIDKNLDASISKNKSNKICRFKYIEGSDLLIIGYSLAGKQSIDYKGKSLVKKGEVFYFRPTKDFNIEFFDHSFLCYFIDLNSLERSLCCRNCNICLNHICKRGEITIEKSPYIMESYIDEIKQIRKLEIDSFLEYADIKGKLFNYLTWFVKLKLNSKSVLNENRCELYYVSNAKKIIIDNLDKQITVKEIAEKLDISTYKLQKSFKEIEGTTVYSFIRNAKIDNSKILLKKSGLSIIDISQKVGYENPSKFSTTFKDIIGCTPTEYRKVMKD